MIHVIEARSRKVEDGILRASASPREAIPRAPLPSHSSFKSQVSSLAASGLDAKAIALRLDIGLPAVRKALAGEPQGQRGRPRAVELSTQEQDALARLMLTANTGRGTVSATMAAHVFADAHPPLAAVLSARASKHSLPTAVTEVARRVRGLVAPSRDPRLIRNTGVVTGGMRLHPSGRRWYAGECISIDDVTANTACCVPWPQGGDKCSDRYGVRLGRWQTLIAHCEGTSYVPLYIFAVRWHQSYRGEDAAAIVNALCRLIVKPEILRLEGGVWQGDRVLAALEAMNILLHSVKGRPNQKLVENWIHRFHTRMALAMPHAQVGRYRGEEWETSKLYQACREGRVDPRLHFPMTDEIRDATITSINWLSEHPIESRQYGRWIPQERWQADLAAHPRPPVSAEDVPEWVTAPVLVERIVRRGQVKATADGPDGGGQQHNFCAPELIAWEGRKVRVAFDPFLLDAGAAIIEPQRPAIITQATFTGAKAGKKAIDAAKALRAAMTREIIALRPGKPTRREILHRAPNLEDRSREVEVGSRMNRSQQPEARSRQPQQRPNFQHPTSQLPNRGHGRPGREPTNPQPSRFQADEATQRAEWLDRIQEGEDHLRRQGAILLPSESSASSVRTPSPISH